MQLHHECECLNIAKQLQYTDLHLELHLKSITLKFDFPEDIVPYWVAVGRRGADEHASQISAMCRASLPFQQADWLIQILRSRFKMETKTNIAMLFTSIDAATQIRSERPPCTFTYVQAPSILSHLPAALPDFSRV